MEKFLFGFLWLAVAFDLTDFATANRFDDGSQLLRRIFEQKYEDQNRSKPIFTGPGFEISMKKLPVADGNFHVYALPVGEGSGQVLQCPNGDIAIIDLGSQQGKNRGFWLGKEIIAFLDGHYNLVKNIVITHNDIDHYNLFSEVFSSSSDLSGLSNIYISCTHGNMSGILKNWINNIGALNKLQMFNGGHTCGSSNRKLCEKITLCPGNPEIKARVLSANAANCKNPNKNIDSIVIEITFNIFKMQLNGDFEDYTTGNNEDGPQRKMVDFYGSDLQVTVYMLAHHGADNKANKPVMLNAVKPKAVFVSANPWYKEETWCHPKCHIMDELKFLCKPAETNPNSRFYCGQHPINDLPLNDTFQQQYACGICSLVPPKKCSAIVRTTAFAIYSTTPSKFKINLVHLLTDGIKWGFINNIQQRLTR